MFHAHHISITYYSNFGIYIVFVCYHRQCIVKDVIDYNVKQFHVHDYFQGCPVDLLKAAILFRHRLTMQPNEVSGADAMVLTSLAAVCRLWFKTMKYCDRTCRRKLKRQFRSE